MTEEEKGIQAIIDLQALAGIEETPEQAKTGWRNMTDAERKQTMLVHEMLCGNEK